MYLAVDIGGTKTLIALFSRHGRIIKRVKFKTAKGLKTFIDDLSRHLAEFKNNKIKSVVIAIPGLINQSNEVTIPNRNWGEKVDLYTPLKNLFSCPIYFLNDASLGAISEAHGMKGKVVYLTFSTGIGGGVVKDGEILPESSSFEPGHIIYEYNGKKAEWEDLGSATALENYFHVDYATSLRKREHLEEIAKRVYLGIPDIIKTYQPEVIIFGGPLGKIFKLYAKYLPVDSKIKFVRPRRPLEAVVYGCYFYAKQQESH